MSSRRSITSTNINSTTSSTTDPSSSSIAELKPHPCFILSHYDKEQQHTTKDEDDDVISTADLNNRPWFHSVLCFSDSLRYVARKGVARCILEGDEKALVDAIQFRSRTAECRLRSHLETVTVKRKVVKTMRSLFTSGMTEIWHTFTQECDLVIYAVDCSQWHLIPVLKRLGHSPNKPLFCRRWTTLRPPITNRPNATPYKSLWTRGRYTYQSALDYFLASVYEILGEDFTPSMNDELTNPLGLAFKQLDSMVRMSEVDVHRIDSVIVFNLLAYSYDRYLHHFHDARYPIEDIPMTSEGYWEMKALRLLISHGFSQFEFLEFLSPCHHWFGILLCLLCHPRMLHFHSETSHFTTVTASSSSTDEQHTTPCLPPIIRETAVLLINLIALRCLQPLQRPRFIWTPNELTTGDPGDYLDSLGHLKLRKTYVKRYTEHRTTFHARLLRLRSLCFECHQQPLSLRLLCRNKIRSQLTGVNFQQRLSKLGLPEEMCKFLSYIEANHLKPHETVNVLVNFAHGLVDLDFYNVPIATATTVTAASSSLSAAASSSSSSSSSPSSSSSSSNA